LNIPVKDVFNVSDRSIYPIWFDNMNIYINASGMTESKAYTLAVKDILLVFKDFVVSGLSPIKSDRFSIFPNPVNNQLLNLQLEENYAQVVRTEIYSISGQLLISNQHGIYQGGHITIPLKNLTQGLYFIKVIENERTSSAKFSIE